MLCAEDSAYPQDGDELIRYAPQADKEGQDDRVEWPYNANDANTEKH